MLELQQRDGLALRTAKAAVQSNDPRLAPALAKLKAEADAALHEGPFSVTQLEALPPSGDPREYRSWGSYWWPNPDTADGLPWIRKDGVAKPGAMGNRDQLRPMVEAVQTLALAYHIFNTPDYAMHAVELLRVFFLDEQLGMLPNLRFAQAIPGKCEGRGIGLIDTHFLARIPDAVAMLEAGSALPRKHSQQLREWFDAYRDWFANSDLGQDECKTTNNHGTYYDMQLAGFALFTGHEDQARMAIQRAAHERLPAQFADDGSQPHELARTRSFDYSCMNLRGFFRIAWMARLVDVDMTSPAPGNATPGSAAPGSPGQLLRKACDWYEPFVEDVEGKWQHEQITELKPGTLATLLYEAAATLGEDKYGQWSQRIGMAEDVRVRLEYQGDV